MDASPTEGNHCTVHPVILRRISENTLRCFIMRDTDFNLSSSEQAWGKLSYEEKNKVLYERQKALLDLFLEKKAISQAQHDKSLHDLTNKMKYAPQNARGNTER